MSESHDADALTCQAVYLLQARGPCYSCEKVTSMFAMMVLPPFSLEGEQEPPDDEGAMLSYVGDLPNSLVLAMGPIVGTILRQDFSHMAGSTYWMNHCEHCDAKQGDHFVQGPGGPFWPDSPSAMDAIEALRLEGPFRLPQAGVCYSGAMAEWRDRYHGIVAVEMPRRGARRKRSK